MNSLVGFKLKLVTLSKLSNWFTSLDRRAVIVTQFPGAIGDVINRLPFSIYLHIFAFVMFNQDRFLRTQMIFALSYFHLIYTYSQKFACLMSYHDQNFDLLIIYSLSSVSSCEKSKTAGSYSRTKWPLCRSFSPCFCFLASHRLLNLVETCTHEAATLSSITHINHFLLVVWRRVICLVTLNQLVKV